MLGSSLNIIWWDDDCNQSNVSAKEFFGFSATTFVTYVHIFRFCGKACHCLPDDDDGYFIRNRPKDLRT